MPSGRQWLGICWAPWKRGGGVPHPIPGGAVWVAWRGAGRGAAVGLGWAAVRCCGAPRVRSVRDCRTAPAPPPQVADLRGNPTADLTCAILYIDLRWMPAGRATLPSSELFAVYETYLTMFTEVCHRHNGIADRLGTDYAVAIFPRKSLDCVRAAEALKAGVAGINARLKTSDEPFRLHACAHYGPLRIGFLGSGARLEGGVVGSIVQQVLACVACAPVPHFVRRLRARPPLWGRHEPPPSPIPLPQSP